MIYGRDFEGDTIDLESITGEMGEVIIRGQVMDVEAREIRNEKTILIFPVTDFTDSIPYPCSMLRSCPGSEVRKGYFFREADVRGNS